MGKGPRLANHRFECSYGGATLLARYQARNSGGLISHPKIFKRFTRRLGLVAHLSGSDFTSRECILDEIPYVGLLACGGSFQSKTLESYF